MLRARFERELSYLFSRLSRAADDRELLRPLFSRDGDPRIKRIVESASYAFARVKEKLDDDVPEISHSLVAGALPETLRGTPSATVMKLEDPVNARRTIVEEPAGQRFQSRPIDGVPCIFESVWPVATAPLSLAAATIASREAGVQTLTLRLETYPGVSLASAIHSELRCFVRTRDPIHAIDVVRELCGSSVAPAIRVIDPNGRTLLSRSAEGVKLRWTAVDSPFRLYPGPADRFSSGSALRALFDFPEIYGFFEVVGLGAFVQGLKLPAAMRTLEVTLRLRQPVGEEGMDAETHLDCVPVANVFSDVAVIRDIRDVGACGRLSPSHHAECEVFHVNNVRLIPTHQSGGDVPLRIWERDDATPQNDDELHVRFERRAATGRGPTTLGVSLVRPNGQPGVPRGSIRADLLVSDGQRTDTLLQGDVSRGGDARSVNITRVTPPQPLLFSSRIPWRANAFARMPTRAFADARSLNAFLLIHDAATLREQALRTLDVTPRGVTSSTCRPAERAFDGAVERGDEIDLVLAETVFGSPGATFLAGEMLARAITERADFLRYTRTRWVTREGTVRADYGIRQGERLPPPIG